ncbi:hypothetical protein FND36_10225 [Lachnospiraceae bacterium KGMB03038]|nr:hypothetical protein FND36_10225 [Lachnospiraceae bacterium KGMB03038]
MKKHKRDEHSIKADKGKYMDELENNKPNTKAKERFRRPAYQAAKMIRAQGKQMERKTVAEYLKEKCGRKHDKG